jgi:ATP-dependent protease HslVU (ClpYQ) peptidase subunit
MTVILGLIDKKLNKAYIACDGVEQCGTIINRNAQKVLKFNEDLYIGFSGNSMIRELIKFNSETLLNDIEDTDERFPYILRRNIIEILKKEEISPDSNDQYDMGLVVLYKGRLFYMTGDTGIVKISSKTKDRYYIADSGSGGDWVRSYMFGVMYTKHKIDSDTIKHAILHCGEHYPTMGVCYLDDITCYEIDL